LRGVFCWQAFSRQELQEGDEGFERVFDERAKEAASLRNVEKHHEDEPSVIIMVRREGKK
jgi:hypothetical protein